MSAEVPHTPPDLKTMLEVVQFITSAVVIPGVFALIHRLGKIREHLAHINGNVKEINQWRADHEAQSERDAKNHALTREQCQALHQERLNSVNSRISELWGRIGDRRGDNRSTD
jgi:hypothetical protein